MVHNKQRMKWVFGPGLYCIVPLALTAAAFHGSLNDSFMNWDDDVYVVNNPLIQHLSFKNLHRMFSPSTLVSGSYQPVTILSLAINYAIGKLNPAVYIATNIVLHLLNVLLVFFFIRKLARSDRIAGICAVLFGIHPMHVEPVAWITGRKDVLYAFFFLSALLCYLLYQGKKGRKAVIAYGLTLVLFIISLLSKSAAVTLPAILLLLDFYQKRKFTAALLLEKVPFLIPAILLGILAIQGQQKIGTLDFVAGLPLAGRILVACYSYMFYIIKFIVPVKLSAFYPYPSTLQFASWPFSYKISPLGVLASAGAIYYLRRNKAFVFGFLFFSITIIFLLHFVPVGATITADRFSYIPYIGLSFIVAVCFENLVSGGYPGRSVKALIVTAGILIVAVLGFAAHQRCRVWRDSVTLWSDVIAKEPANGEPYTNLGAALITSRKDDDDEALQYIQKAIALHDSLAYFNLGIILKKAGKFNEALAAFQNVTKFCSNGAQLYAMIGSLLLQSGDIDGALANYRKAVRVYPDSAELLNGLGYTLLHAGQYDEAVAECRSALSKNVGNSTTHLNLADALRQLGRTEEAIAEYRSALSIDSSNTIARNNLAGMLRQLGRTEEAVAQYRRALESDPRSIEARLNLGRVLLKSGQRGDADACFNKAVEVNSSDLDSLHHLCEVFMQIRQPEYAIKAANQALMVAKASGQEAVVREIAGNIEEMRRGMKEGAGRKKKKWQSEKVKDKKNEESGERPLL